MTCTVKLKIDKKMMMMMMMMINQHDRTVCLVWAIPEVIHITTSLQVILQSIKWIYHIKKVEIRHVFPYYIITIIWSNLLSYKVCSTHKSTYTMRQFWSFFVAQVFMAVPDLVKTLTLRFCFSISYWSLLISAKLLSPARITMRTTALQHNTTEIMLIMIKLC